MGIAEAICGVVYTRLVNPVESVLEQLAYPPIHEAVCGIKFEGIGSLDPVKMAAFWSQRQDRYPTYELHPALRDANELIWSSAPLLRLWLVSPTKETVLQLQHDRFFFNWRRLDNSDYPRFNDHADVKGLLSRLNFEFNELQEFCEQTLGARPRPVRCEVTKIDQFIENDHWADLADLARMVPALQGFASLPHSDESNFSLQFSETRDGSVLNVSVQGPARSADPSRRIVVLETTVMRALQPSESLNEAFVTANKVANDVFAQCVPLTERSRFSTRLRSTRGEP